MKVLIADDDPVSRRLLECYLERWGYEVRLAVDGAEAWRMYQQDDFPLVISDWTMPEMDGLALIRNIRAAPQGAMTYVILVTSKSQKEDLVEGMDAGADDFVTKPFDRDELRVRLREGERTIRLERTLLEQNQASAAMHAELTRLLAEVGAELTRLRDDPSSSQPVSIALQNSIAKIQQLAALVEQDARSS